MTIPDDWPDRGVMLDGVCVGRLVPTDNTGYHRFQVFCNPADLRGEVAQYGPVCTKRARMLTYLENHADDLAGRLLNMARFNAAADPNDHQARWCEINRVFAPTTSQPPGRVMVGGGIGGEAQ